MLFRMRVNCPSPLLTVSRERKMHRMQRHAEVKTIRRTARNHASNWLRDNVYEHQPIVGKVRVVFRTFQARGVLADTANHLPACKAVLDGIVDAGVLPDDKPEIVTSQLFLPPQRGTDAVLIIIDRPVDYGL